MQKYRFKKLLPNEIKIVWNDIIQIWVLQIQGWHRQYHNITIDKCACPSLYSRYLGNKLNCKKISNSKENVKKKHLWLYYVSFGVSHTKQRQCGDWIWSLIIIIVHITVCICISGTWVKKKLWSILSLWFTIILSGDITRLRSPCKPVNMKQIHHC